MTRRIWRDGEFVDWQDATVHILAQSLQRGSLAFDYMSVHETPNGVAIFRLQDHIERLVKTCHLVGLPLAYTLVELIDASAATVRGNQGAKSVKISALIPSIEVELVPQDPTVSVFIAAYDSARDIIAKNKGEYRSRTDLKLKIEHSIQSRREDIIPPHAKVAANYTSSMTAKWKARSEGFDDIILLDDVGNVAEAPTSNLFVVTEQGGLLTPPDEKVLLGITRDTVMQLAPAMGIACTTRNLTVDDLVNAAEIFLTATSAGVWPVMQIDDHVVGNGEVGAVTERLREKFAAVTRGLDPAFEHWLHYV